MQRYLTKSRFKLALDCPAKLFYTGKSQYPDKSQDDAFLEALAEGGFQVGALAKCYYPDGIEITERGYDIPLQKHRNFSLTVLLLFSKVLSNTKIYSSGQISLRKKGTT